MNQDYKTLSIFTVLIASCLLLLSLPFLRKANTSGSRSWLSLCGGKTVSAQADSCLLHLSSAPQANFSEPAPPSRSPGWFQKCLSMVTVSSSRPGLKPFIARGLRGPYPSCLVLTMAPTAISLGPAGSRSVRCVPVAVSPAACPSRAPSSQIEDRMEVI